MGCDQALVLFLNFSVQRQSAVDTLSAGRFSRPEHLDEAQRDGAVLRVRSKAMTVAVILAGLFPLLVGTSTGAEVMQRLAAPMIGGMLTAPLLSLLVMPAIYKLLGVERLGSMERKSAEGEPVPA